VLIFRPGSLGDTIVALPCFHLIERAFPTAERLLLTPIPRSSRVVPVDTILKDGGFVHGSIPYPGALRSPVTLAKLASRIRRVRAHTLIYLPESKGPRAARRDVAFFKLCGIKRIIGAPLTAELDRPRVDSQGEPEPESQRLGRRLAELGAIDFSDRAWWDLRLTAEERANAREALGPLVDRPFISVGSGAKIAAKDWGTPNWASLLTLLDDQLTGYGMAFIGGRDDREQADELAARWSAGPAVNLCGRLTARQSAAALSVADLFISHDGGPLHLADAVGTPCVGLFGDYSSRAWHPTGEWTRIIHPSEGLAKITPQLVADAARRLLSEVGAHPAPDASATRVST
jgi:heptosyltransferase-3